MRGGCCSGWLLGFANLCVTFCKFQTYGLWHIRIESNPLLKVLFRRLCTGPRVKSHETHRRRCFPIFACDFQQGSLVPLVCSEEQIELPRLGVHRQAAHEQGAHLVFTGGHRVDGVHTLRERCVHDASEFAGWSGVSGGCGSSGWRR